MDAFEKIIGQLLQEEKYWAKHSVKINLTTEEKRSINKPSTPRLEINVIAYDVNRETVLFWKQGNAKRNLSYSTAM